MSRKYKFHNPEGSYFVSFAVVNWIDVFTRNEYKNIIVESLEYCQKSKGLEVFSWVIMTNHVHLVIRSSGAATLPEILRDFKKFTSKKIIKAIKENSKESRREWMLNQFWDIDKNGYRFWRADNKPIEIWSNHVIDQKINYVQNNPVEAGLVIRAEDYVYSSARDYSGDKGLLDVVIAK